MRNTGNRRVALLIVAWCAIAAPIAAADVSLPMVFSDAMVLQQQMPLPVWGNAAPGEQVTVHFAGQQKTAPANAQGEWKVVLDPLAASAIPAELTIDAANHLVVKNILVGEVWVCSGQSNMEKPIGDQPGQKATINAPAEIAAANFPAIRLLQIPKSGDPAVVATARWAECSPETVQSLRFSAVGYFFARKIHTDLNVPAGMIHTSWGGTRIEPWTPLEALDAVPSLKPFADAVRKRPPTTLKASGTPTGLWTAMVQPLVPFAIRGALWYQGESNVMSHDRAAYLDKMRALVSGWRDAWGEGDFPFYFVQLAPFTYSTRPTFALNEHDLPAVWEAQLNAMKLIPNTGMVVITDLVNNVHDIHPTRKREVGERLAGWALAKTYGKSAVVYSGPLYKSADFTGGRAIIHFDSMGTGLTSRDGKALSDFTIAGPDQNFVPADAHIEGDTVVVSSAQVANPSAVRFGWNEAAMPNLQNKQGLPASPFRTDNWPLPLSPKPPTTATAPSATTRP